MQYKKTHLSAHFEDLAQQRDADTVGMWVFLSTEIMFFGGLFLTYMVFRIFHPAGFAEGSKLLELPLGAVNTAILLTSSLTMALAVHAGGSGKRKLLVFFLMVTIILGLAFLGIKFTEYYHKFQDHHFPGEGFAYAGPHKEGVRIFLWLYFSLTALHALHMIIGICVLFVLVINSSRGKYSSEYFMPVEITGLYWHFVDVIWIFLFPLLYLIK